MIIGLLSILAVLFAIPAPLVGAEQVWDSDLKRYLTDQEMNMATVYLQEEEGIKVEAIAEGSELEFKEKKHWYGVSAMRNVGYGYWQRQYAGRRDVIGQTIDVGVSRYTIVGVAPARFTGTELRDVEVWLPITAADGLRFAKGSDWTSSANSQWLLILARLKPGVLVQHAEAQASTAYRNWEIERLSKFSPKAPAYVDSETVMLGSLRARCVSCKQLGIARVRRARFARIEQGSRQCRLMKGPGNPNHRILHASALSADRWR